VVSAGLKYGVSPPLTPGELHSIFFTTADDIDVPESREPEALEATAGRSRASISASATAA
jgi:hypothetical protein